MPLAQTWETARTVGAARVEQRHERHRQRNDQRQDHHGGIEKYRPQIMQTSVPSGLYAASNTALFPGCTIPPTPLKCVSPWIGPIAPPGSPHAGIRTNHHRAASRLRCHHCRRTRRAAGAAAARLCGIDALLARAGRGPRRHGLSRHCAEPARLFAGRPAGSARVFALPDRPPDGRCDGDRGGCRLWECALSSRRPRLGRQHRLGHRRPPPRAAGLAHHSLAAASERVQSRADG